MFENKGLIVRLLIAICCFIYSSLLLQSSRKNSASFHGGVGELSFGLWAILDLIQFTVTGVEGLMFIQSLIYLCAQTSTCALIAFTYYLFTKDRDHELKRIYLIYILPSVTVLLMLGIKFFTNVHFFIKVPKVVSLANLPAYNFPKTIFYYIHSVFCYTSIGLCIIYSIYREFKRPKIKKIVVIVYVVSSIIFLVMNIYKFFIENFYPVLYLQYSDFSTSISYFILSVASFIVIYSNSKESLMRSLDKTIFSASSFPIFVFSKDEDFIEANHRGYEFLKKYSIDINTKKTFDQIFSENNFARLGFFEDEQEGGEFYLSAVTNRSLYYGKKIELFSKKREIGYYLIIVKVNIYSEMKKRMENESDTDELTGLKKQISLEKFFTEEIISHLEPLIFVCAKINNLEHLNNTIGLKKTNFYITNFSDILKENLNEMNLQQEIQKNLFRVSGSLFAFIISAKQQELIPEFFKSVKRSCSQFSKNRVEELSCSLAYTIANNRETSALTVLQKSYENLFFDKD